MRGSERGTGGGENCSGHWWGDVDESERGQTDVGWMNDEAEGEDNSQRRRDENIGPGVRSSGRETAREQKIQKKDLPPSTTATAPSSLGGGLAETKVSQERVKDSMPAAPRQHQ